MWLATPLPSFRPAVRPAQTQTRAAVTSAAFWATGTWSSAGTDRSSACSWRSPPAKCDFLSHVASNGQRTRAHPSPIDARDGPRDGRRRRQGHGGAAGAARGHGCGARAHGAGDRPAVATPWRATPRTMDATRRLIGAYPMSAAKDGPAAGSRRTMGEAGREYGRWRSSRKMRSGGRPGFRAYFFTINYFNLALDANLTLKT